jgi:hypothetical protein
MSEEPKNSAAPPSKEPITKAALENLGLKAREPPSSAPTPEKSMKQLLQEAGFKVAEPRGDGFITGIGGPIRPTRD